MGPKLPELGTEALPLRELPLHPRLSWRCTRMLATVEIPVEVWDGAGERH